MTRKMPHSPHDLNILFVRRWKLMSIRWHFRVQVVLYKNLSCFNGIARQSIQINDLIREVYQSHDDAT